MTMTDDVITIIALAAPLATLVLLFAIWTVRVWRRGTGR